MKKKPGMKVFYTYVKPKTPQEKEEAERRLQSAYDILFDAMQEKGLFRIKKTNGTV